ncbi:hypothetical protein ACWPM1_13315 [Tsuneonella sp. HG249]
MVLTAVRSLQTMLFAVLMAMAMSPASAHEDHDKQSRQRAEVTSQPSQMTPAAMHEMMEDHAVAMEAAAPKTLDQRVMSWAGRTHPFAVHFPIALFPVALVALILARRRGETVELIRSLIIVAGVASVIAGAHGWLLEAFPWLKMTRCSSGTDGRALVFRLREPFLRSGPIDSGARCSVGQWSWR